MGKKGKIAVLALFFLVFIGISNKISFEKVIDEGEEIINTISLGNKEYRNSGEKGGQENIKTGNPLYIRVFKEEKEHKRSRLQKG